MNVVLAQTKRQVYELFCQYLNKAIAKIADAEKSNPARLAEFYLDLDGLPYCRLQSGESIEVQYDINPILVEGTIQVFVNLGHPDYGHHALKLLMDVPMLELYKDYLTQFIDEAIVNEFNRASQLSNQPGINHRH